LPNRYIDENNRNNDSRLLNNVIHESKDDLLNEIQLTKIKESNQEFLSFSHSPSVQSQSQLNNS